MKQRPLRFCMVTTFYPPFHFGGDALYVQRLTDALLRRGHDVDVIHDVDAFRMLQKQPTPAAPNVETIQSGGSSSNRLTIHRLQSGLGRLGCLLTHQTGRPIVHGKRIRKILTGGGFDVIHFHNVSLVGGPGVLAYGDALKLYTAHEHWLVCPTHVLWRHNRETCDGRQCLRCTLAHCRPPQWWRTTGLLEDKARHVDAFLSPSRFSIEKHAEFGFPYPMHQLPCFLPPAGPAPTSSGSNGRRPYFLFVGRLEKIKGLQDVIGCFEDDTALDLLVVGTGSYEAALRQQASGKARVRFLGRKSPDELRSLYAHARAVIVPSLVFETFGMVVLEAFQQGTPVIARALGPLGEIVEESGGGLLFEDQPTLQDALNRLGDDAGFAQRLGQSGRQALQKNWSEAAVLPQYFDLIRHVARENGRRELADRAFEFASVTESVTASMQEADCP